MITYGRRTEKGERGCRIAQGGMERNACFGFRYPFLCRGFATVQGAEWLKAFDYSTLIGKFGTMKDPAKATFVGMGGVSARGGFILPYRSFLPLCWPLVL